MMLLNKLLLELGLANNDIQAKTLINCGLVFIGDKRADSKTKITKKDIEEGLIRVKYTKQFVSRGAVKFESINSNYQIDINQKICIDLGSSTGGFTQQLLLKGAKCVYAIDVAKGIIDNKLKQDARVILLEKTNARYMNTDEKVKKIIKKQSVDIAVADLSFISLKLIIPALIPYLKKGAYFIPLVKPQFEVKKQDVPKGGVITDKKLIDETLASIYECLKNNGFNIIKSFPSGLKGPSGNMEYFIISTT